jgi:hypothetical protein
MKHPIARPSEKTMRFFSPELYVRFNSSDADEADRANEEWETALHEYRRHLEGLHDQLPSQVRRLAELCLHDAELLAFNQVIEPVGAFPVEPLWPASAWSAVGILCLKQDAEALSLIYFLWDRVTEHPPPSDWTFSRERKHWLYDEVDVAPGGRRMFWHRVLFSDGSVIEIPFVAVFMCRFPLELPEDGRSTAMGSPPGEGRRS